MKQCHPAGFLCCKVCKLDNQEMPKDNIIHQIAPSTKTRIFVHLLDIHGDNNSAYLVISFVVILLFYFSRYGLAFSNNHVCSLSDW